MNTIRQSGFGHHHVLRSGKIALGLLEKLRVRHSQHKQRVLELCATAHVAVVARQPLQTGQRHGNAGLARLHLSGQDYRAVACAESVEDSPGGLHLMFVQALHNPVDALTMRLGLGL